MKRAITTLCLILFAAVASGATVEISTEGWTDSGVMNGWSFANLGEDGAMGAKSVIESPKLEQQAIAELTLTLQCSTVMPAVNISYALLRNGKVVAPPKSVWPVAFANRRENQSMSVNPELRANAVRIFGADGWCVSSIQLQRRPCPQPGLILRIS